jgi:serine/threonine-protein kinase
VSHVFVSYKAEDRPRVAPLVRALEDDGYSVWWDADIGGGDEWRDAIVRALDSAGCVIVAWSKHSVGPGGHFVRDEATRALRRAVYLPVTFDPIEPPLGFGETQALDLKGWNGDRRDARYQALLAAVGRRMGGETVPRAAPAPAPRLQRRTVVIGGTALAAAAAGIGAWTLLKPDRAPSNSIAVLPFANLSGDPAQAYFSDGIAEELRSALSRIPGLQVVARTSSEIMGHADAKTAAGKLGVTNILTGSVRKTAKMIRVTAQLIDGKKGLQRWSQAYDRPFGDAIEIQTDIATKVAEALSIQLRADDRQALAEGGTANAAAQDLLLKAQEIARHEDSDAGLQRALGTIDSALLLDPRYANAFAAKSVILAIQGSQRAGSALQSRQILAQAEKLARHAIGIAAKSAQAHGALGFILHSQLRIGPSLRELAIMASLPGGGPRADFNSVDNYAWILGLSGRSAEAIDRARQMVETDPLNPFAYHTMAVVLGQARRFREAAEYDQKAIALAPDLRWPHAFRGFLLMEAGDLDGAAAEFERLDGESGVWLAWQAILAHRRGNLAESKRLMAKLREWGGDAAHYQYAEVYAQQGLKDQAIAALEDAWSTRDPGLGLLNIDPQLDPLRKDPRFEAIVRRLDFPS